MAIFVFQNLYFTEVNYAPFQGLFSSTASKYENEGAGWLIKADIVFKSLNSGFDFSSTT